MTCQGKPQSDCRKVSQTYFLLFLIEEVINGKSGCSRQYPGKGFKRFVNESVYKYPQVDQDEDSREDRI